MAVDRLVAGDTLYFLDTVEDYPPADGWTLKYRLVPLFSTPTMAPVTLTASTSGSDYIVQASPDQTAAWVAGTYSWARWVEKTGARQTLDPLTPFLEVVADPSYTAQGYDPRSTARKVVAQLEAALVTYTGSNGHVAEYEIAGRRMKFRSEGEILSMLSKFRAEVWREDAVTAMQSGLPNPRNVLVRFGRA